MPVDSHRLDATPAPGAAAALASDVAFPPSERRASRRFFLLLLSVAAIAMCVLMRPLAPTLLFAAVLAAALSPLYERFNARLFERRQLSAIVFTALFFLVVMVPVLLAVVSGISDVVAVATSLSQRVQSEGLDGLLARVPAPLQDRLRELDVSMLQARLGELTGRVMAFAGAFLKATGDAVLSLVILLVALVVLLTDGRRLLHWLDETAPLKRGQMAEIFREFRKISVSVIVGNFGTSAIQALVALAGYLIAGAPSPLVLTLLTFVFSFVPAVGGAGTALAAAAWLGLMGDNWHALFLAIWAVAVVGTVDNIVKPALVKRGVKLHGALVFFAILSGIAAFGASGVLLGPIIVTFTLTLLRIYRRDMGGRSLDVATTQPLPTLSNVPPAQPAPPWPLKPAPAR